MELYGTHGTTVTRSRKILQSKTFVAGRRAGRAGPGSYFWAYATTSNIAEMLAHQWWDFACSQQFYGNDINKSCSILRVQFKVPIDEYFDATDLAFQEELFALAEEQDCKTPKQLCDLYEVVVEDIERQLGQKLAVIMAMVPSPRPADGARTLVNLLFSMSRCYVLRHNRNDLLVNVEEVELS